MKKITAYGYRDPGNAFLPRDVLAALGRPPHVKQGSLIVFATSATDAWRQLGRLDMAPSSSRRLGPVTGPRVRALVSAGLDHLHATYAMPEVGGDLVVIMMPLNGDHPRVVNHIGQIHQGVFLSVHVEPTEPAVTPDMVTAALRVAANHEGFALVLNRGVFQEIIAAALKARDES
jgi:hypothetical protein